MDNHTQVAKNIAENDTRRAVGNKLVNPPSRHLGGGRFENAVLDGRGGYYYPSDLAVLGIPSSREGDVRRTYVSFTVSPW